MCNASASRSPGCISGESLRARSSSGCMSIRPTQEGLISNTWNLSSDKTQPTLGIGPGPIPRASDSRTVPRGSDRRPNSQWNVLPCGWSCTSTHASRKAVCGCGPKPTSVWCWIAWRTGGGASPTLRQRVLSGRAKRTKGCPTTSCGWHPSKAAAGGLTCVTTPRPLVVRLATPGCCNHESHASSPSPCGPK